MGAYAYCREPGCEHGLDKPNLDDLSTYGRWCCAAGHENDLREDKASLIAEVANDRLKELEERLSAAEQLLELYKAQIGVI